MKSYDIINKEVSYFINMDFLEEVDNDLWKEFLKYSL